MPSSRGKSAPNLMYHFVGREESLKGISLRDFGAQLDALRKSFPSEELVLTFDHGTIDHFEYAAPELEKRGMNGVFFCLTMAQEEHRVHPIDKQRQLEASYRRELARLLCAELEIPYCPDDAAEYLPQFSFYSPEERYFRFLRDGRVAKEVYTAFIDRLFERTFGSEHDYAVGNYLSWDHVVALHRRGHRIGSHTHYHIGDAEDFSKSVKLIEERIGEKVDCVSYPNGVKRITDEELRSLGIRKGYLSSDIDARGPYRLPRIDCNLL